MLGTKNDQFKDVARKLHMVKHGALVAQPFMLQASLPAAEGDNLVEVYSDKGYKYISHSLNYKRVFKIWANHVYDKENPAISIEEMKQLFPEFAERLDVYQMCCNQQGQTVKNHDFY